MQPTTLILALLPLLAALIILRQCSQGTRDRKTAKRDAEQVRRYQAS
jgi:hypothetical protein